MNQESAATTRKAEGNVLFLAGKYDAALAKYKEACRLCPHVAIYWSNAAACYEKLKEYTQMKQAAKQCVQLDETSIKGYYRLAVAQRELDELNDSLQTIQKGLELCSQQQQQVENNNNSGGGGGYKEDFVLLELDVKDRMDILKCQHCGSPGTTLVCSKCKGASYCSVECQRADWFKEGGHKKKCVEPGKVSAVLCACCNEMISAASQRICPKCSFTRYCSRRCLLNHRPLHKLQCESVEQTMYSATVDNLQLFQEWKSQAGSALVTLATHAISKKKFLEQPPDFGLHIQVKFNYNYMTYMPISEPRVLELKDPSIPDALRVQETQRIHQVLAELKKKSPSLVQPTSSPILHLLFIQNGDQPGFSVVPIGMSASGFRDTTREHIMHILRFEYNLNHRLLNVWKSGPYTRNLSAQVSAIVNADIETYRQFLFHAFRLYSKNPCHMTHALMIDYDAGFDLGQIQALQKYKLVTLKSMRDLYRGKLMSEDVNLSKQVLEECLDVENCPALLNAQRNIHPASKMFAVIFRADSYDESMNRLLPIHGNIHIIELPSRSALSNKQCDKKASELFQLLQAISLPAITSPDLASIKPEPRCK